MDGIDVAWAVWHFTILGLFVYIQLILDAYHDHCKQVVISDSSDFFSFSPPSGIGYDDSLPPSRVIRLHSLLFCASRLLLRYETTNPEGAWPMLHFIFNPVAGKGKALRFRAKIEKRLLDLNVEHRFHETHGPREAMEIAQNLTGRANDDALDLVAMGGDGTLNEVLNGLTDPSRVRLGIVPCGSGNDFATAASIPLSPLGALDLLLNGEAKYTDYMECSGIRGINVIGTGIDVDILRRYERMKLLKGSAAYLASLVLTLLSFKPRSFSEILDGKSVPHSAFIACAGNGRNIGGGIPICPEAIIDDGLIDIVIVDNISRHRIPAAFVKLLQKKILALPTTTFRRGKRLKVISDASIPIQIDGEIYDHLPFDVRVIGHSLRVYRP